MFSGVLVSALFVVALFWPTIVTSTGNTGGASSYEQSPPPTGVFLPSVNPSARPTDTSGETHNHSGKSSTMQVVVVKAGPKGPAPRH